MKAYLISIFRNNFVSFSKSNDFNDLSHKIFKNIISSSDLNVSSELEVFEAIVSWVEHDEINRAHFMCDLLKKVRLHLLASEIVKSVIKTNKFCLRCQKCCNHIKSVFIKREESTKSLSRNLQNRCCINEYTSFMLGDRDEKPGASFSLNLFAQQQQTLQINSVEFANKALYNSKYYIHLFSKDTKEWISLQPEDDYRDGLSYFACCLFMGNLYASGGEWDRRGNPSDSLYKFDPKTKDWIELTEMHYYRSYHSCVVFGGKIVVTGGDWNANNSVEAYDHYNDKWSIMPSLTEEKYGHGSLAMGNKLYVIGGREMHSEVFDYISNRFARIKPMPLEFNSKEFETFRVQNKIVVKQDGDEIYIYNTTDDTWTSMTVDLFNEKPAKLLYF